MSTLLDEHARRQAKSRAIAVSILDAPRVIRRFVAVDTGLRASARLRSTRPKRDVPARRPARRPDGGDDHPRRRIAAAVLALQALLLGCAFLLPAFRVTSVEVTGTSLLSRGAVLTVSGLGDGRSIFAVDGDAVRNRLLALGWVQSATVETNLPNAVHITVHEWPPIMRLRTHGRDLLVSAGGASVPLDATKSGAASGLPVLGDDRVQGGATADAALAGGALARMLSLTAQRYPAVFGCTVALFQWTADGMFSIDATTGWRAILGHLDTADAIAAVPQQIAALSALKGSLDFAHPAFGYVDLENPAAPAVGGTPVPVVTAPATAAPTAKPAAPNSPAAPVATPAPTATPPPTPTPVPGRKFILPPPVSH